MDWLRFVRDIERRDTRKMIVPLAVSAIGAGVSALGSIAGGIFGGGAARRARERAERAQRESENKEMAWYNRRYNEDYSDTAAGRNLLRIAKDYARDNWKRESGAAAVGGGTDASVAMAKSQGTKMVGDTIANMGAQDTARKDNIDSIHQKNVQSYDAQRSEREYQYGMQKASNITQAAQGMSNAVMSGVTSLVGGSNSSSTPTGVDGKK